jgi:hypothetical protein
MRGLPAYGVARRSNSLGVLRQRDAGGSSSSPLLTDLAAYWKLDDLTWSDSVGSNNLTNNGGVTVGTPKLGAGSAEFDGTNTLSLASTPAVTLDGTTSFTLAGWFRTSSTATQTVVGKKDGASPSTEYILLLLSSGTSLRWDVGSDNVTASTILSINTWYFFVAQYDTTSGNCGISVNAGSFATTSATPATISNPFYIGSRDNTLSFFEGVIDEVGIWKRLLTSGEISDLYNSGSGLSYPFS